MNTLRKIVGVILLAAVPVSGLAQTSLTSWQNLQSIAADKTIRVVRLNPDAREVNGKFLRFSQDEIFILVDKQRISIRRDDVQRIDVRKSPRGVFRALIGAGIGTAVGLAVLAGARSEDTFYGVAVPLFPVFIGAGAVTGALLPGYSTIYSTQ